MIRSGSRAWSRPRTTPSASLKGPKSSLLRARWRPLRARNTTDSSRQSLQQASWAYRNTPSPPAWCSTSVGSMARPHTTQGRPVPRLDLDTPSTAGRRASDKRARICPRSSSSVAAEPLAVGAHKGASGRPLCLLLRGCNVPEYRRVGRKAQGGCRGARQRGAAAVINSALHHDYMGPLLALMLRREQTPFHVGGGVAAPPASSSVGTAASTSRPPSRSRSSRSGPA